MGNEAFLLNGNAFSNWRAAIPINILKLSNLIKRPLGKEMIFNFRTSNQPNSSLWSNFWLEQKWIFPRIQHSTVERPPDSPIRRTKSGVRGAQLSPPTRSWSKGASLPETPSPPTLTRQERNFYSALKCVHTTHSIDSSLGGWLSSNEITKRDFKSWLAGEQAALLHPVLRLSSYFKPNLWKK